MEFNKAALSLADAFPADQKKAALNRLLKVGRPAGSAWGAGGCRAGQQDAALSRLPKRGGWPCSRARAEGCAAVPSGCRRALELTTRAGAPLTRPPPITPPVLPQDNVALIAVLEALEPPFADGGAGSGGGGGGGGSRRQLVCVANTHIHSNPELNDVKLWQVGAGRRVHVRRRAAASRRSRAPSPSCSSSPPSAPDLPRCRAAPAPQVHTLLKGLEKIAASADIPMLVAGDFNATPGSAAHAMLVRGAVPPNNPVSRRHTRMASLALLQCGWCLGGAGPPNNPVSCVRAPLSAGAASCGAAAVPRRPCCRCAGQAPSQAGRPAARAMGRRMQRRLPRLAARRLQPAPPPLARPRPSLGLRRARRSWAATRWASCAPPPSCSTSCRWPPRTPPWRPPPTPTTPCSARSGGWTPPRASPSARSVPP